MKNLIYLSLTLFFAFIGQSTNAQEVKLKKDQILVDEKPTFEYDKSGFEFHIYKLGTKDEIIYILHNNNSTQQYLEDDYKKIIFLNQKVTIESSVFRARGFKYIVELMLKEKVLDLEGNISTDNLEKFAAKYNENITERTIRLN
jgi:hypothetical protein